MYLMWSSRYLHESQLISKHLCKQLLDSYLATYKQCMHLNQLHLAWSDNTMLFDQCINDEFLSFDNIIDITIGYIEV